jgi:hypothetical protein
MSVFDKMKRQKIKIIFSTTLVLGTSQKDSLSSLLETTKDQEI